ncbi:MAG: MoaD/ThiS family protein [Gemmatimonadota bacterium]|nr:MoaD/ThiS family protein [Gemmatimonadota bacterium]
MTESGQNRMHVRVQLFGSYREVAPGDYLELDVPVGATVGDLVDQLRDLVPGRLPRRPVVAVNRRHAPDGQVLEASDELAMIPAVAGG